VPQAPVLHLGVLSLLFFAFALPPSAPFTPSQLAFNPQFCPFPAYYLTYPYWHAILSRVCQASTPNCSSCPLWGSSSGLSPRLSSSSGHSTSFLSNAYGLFCAMDALQPLCFQSLADSFHRNGGCTPLCRPQTALRERTFCARSRYNPFLCRTSAFDGGRGGQSEESTGAAAESEVRCAG
jgi:hypothetical protein